MSKEQESSPINQFSPSPFTSWLLMNSKMIGLISSVIIVAALFYAWMAHNKTMQEYKDLQEAEFLAEELEKTNPIFPSEGQQNTPDPLQKIVEKLQVINNQYPSLQGRYNGLIAQELLFENKDADPYAERCIQRLENSELPLFAEFSEISRQTAKQQYQSALNIATALNAKLTESSLSAPDMYVLRAFVLLHMAALQKKLQSPENYKQTIETLKAYLGTGSQPATLTDKQQELAANLLAHLQEQDESLLNYLATH